MKACNCGNKQEELQLPVQTLKYGTVGVTEVQWDGLNDLPSVKHRDRLFRKYGLGR